jgi:hypothetical protein
MSVKRKFNCPMSTLVKEGELVVAAAESHPEEMNRRLGATAVAGTRAVLDSLSNRTSKQAEKTADLGDLTGEQSDHVVALLDLFGQAKETAKRAFKGQDVKLGSEFQVGVNSPADLGSVLQRVKIVRDSCATAENAAALAAKGWIADDTAALGAAITAVEESEAGQERGKTIRIAATDERNGAANTLFEGLLTIQNAANIQWPERVEANRAVRREFRLDVFPPSHATAKQAAPVPPVPAAREASAVGQAG